LCGARRTAAVVGTPMGQQAPDRRPTWRV